MNERQESQKPLEEAVHAPPAAPETLKGKIDQVLMTLTYHEREIIKFRYGLDDDVYRWKLKTIGGLFKRPTHWVRRIETKAILKLQHPKRSRLLEGFRDTLADENYATPQGRLLRKVFGVSFPRRTPSLFEFATSERCQDAFISWLIAWARHNHREVNEPLHRTGVFLLGRLLDLHGIEPPAEYTRLKIRKYKAIDILVEVNKDIVVPIEDKVGSIEHSDQLIRYLKTVQNDFKGRTPAPIYLKTGDQLEDYEAIEKAGWKCFFRRHMLEVIDYGKQQGVENDIFNDFHSRLMHLDEASWRKHSRLL
jgi:hypothetical protein